MDLQNVPVSNRVICASTLIEVYDICNHFIPAKIKEFRALYGASNDETDLDSALKALDKLSSLGLVRDDSTLKDDSVLQEKAQELLKQEIMNVLKPIHEDSKLQKSFNRFLAANNIKDLKKDVIENNQRGPAKKIRERLIYDFALWEGSDPKNPAIDTHREKVCEQIDSLDYAVIYAQEDPSKKTQLRDDFAKKKKVFFKLLGNLLFLGQQLEQGKPYHDICKTIRELSGCQNMSDDEIKKLAQKTYNITAEGLFAHKQAVDLAAGKQAVNPCSSLETYKKNNISPWISSLKRGENNILDLAFLSPDEKNNYTRYETVREEIAKMHVTVHHKIPLKYFNLVASQGDEHFFDLNDISNMMLVIGGGIHDSLHKDDMEHLVRLNPSKDDGLVLAPKDKREDPKQTNKVSMPIPEPRSIGSRRPPKKEKSACKVNNNDYTR